MAAEETLPVWMNRRQVAAYLAITVRTLETWAQRGGGPPYYKLRPRCIRYKREDVDTWAQSQPRLHTQDDGSAGAVLKQMEIMRTAHTIAGRRHQ